MKERTRRARRGGGMKERTRRARNEGNMKERRDKRKGGEMRSYKRGTDF